MRLRFVAAVVVTALAAPGCAGKPAAPRSLCGIPISSDAVDPLLPEGDEVTVGKLEKPEYLPTACPLYVDDDYAYTFAAKHDPDGDDYVRQIRQGSPSEPRTFKGKLTVRTGSARAVADCPGAPHSVYAEIQLNPVIDEVFGKATPEDLENFLNAYVPGVQKHYGCKT
ncbi:hypothetical protein E1293_44555 [Actinomadura darangshiensis]|uniref:DUF3558 domain-containing protein n=1 Tax=Actinomadura darangshiensis TaxID=705336 RepID=A0A4R4ZXC2_9ACTN|nr:hypothetical protein [Actinomadura darangshiensis]TDD61842.1 hypothetical protein E1293_44555 [Actinomadura darangshiensis]